MYEISGLKETEEHNSKASLSKDFPGHLGHSCFVLSLLLLQFSNVAACIINIVWYVLKCMSKFGYCVEYVISI